MRYTDTRTHIVIFFPHDFCMYRFPVSLLKKFINMVASELERKYQRWERE